MNDSPVTLFIPLGNDRSNAGLTLRGESIAEVTAALEDLNLTDETEESKLSILLNGVATVKAGVELILPSSTPSQPKAAVTHPQAQSTPSDAPSCVHGSMKWKEGTSKQGNAYKGWFCPAAFGQTQCKPQFVK